MTRKNSYHAQAGACGADIDYHLREFKNGTLPLYKVCIAYESLHRLWSDCVFAL